MKKTVFPLEKCKLGWNNHFWNFLCQCKMKKILRKFLGQSDTPWPTLPQYTQRWSPFRFSNHRLPKATTTIKLKTRPDKVWLRPLCPQRTRLRSAITPLFDSDICQFYVPPSLLLLKICQSKINSSWVAGPIGQTNRRPSVWCSKYYFFSWFLAEFFAKTLSIYLFTFLKK